jgi:exodeoxyribonuclease VII large subunit
MVVGVVTSPRGAALRDIINVVSRRWPARLVVSPAVVQGAAAAESLVAALQQIQLHPSVEVVICGRGGGSMEDLAAFNDERVVRAIASCRVPIISAVGHEIDVSLSDLAADRRAPTPSAAAELAVPDRREICKAIEGLSGTLRHFLIGRLRKEHLELVRLRGRLGDPTRRLAVARQDVDALWQRLARATRLRVRGEMCRCDELIDRLHSVHPKARLKRRRQRLVELSFRLADAQRGCLDRARRRLTEARMDIRASAMRWLAPRRRRLEATSGKLGGLDPLSVLDRGYSLVTDESGAPLHDARRVSRGDAVSVRMSRGGLACRVEEVFAGENGSGEERRPCESKRKT